MPNFKPFLLKKSPERDKIILYVFIAGCHMNIEDRNKLEDRFQYILKMRPLLNKQALFSDTTQDYVSPSEPRLKEKITIKFRTAKNNVDAVYLISKDKIVDMVKTETDDSFDYYSCNYVIDEKVFSYCFKIAAGSVICYYNSRGISKDIQEYYNFRVLAGFRTPTWAKGAVMYQIYVDRFCNGDKSNDVLTNEYTYLDGFSEQVTDWEKYPAQMGVREFYGGDLQGVLDKMDYLEDLGVDVIYFNPLFVSPSNHKYDIQDYDYIDPHIGKIVEDEGELLSEDKKENRFATRYIKRVTDKKNLEASNELFAKVVKEAHKRGMKVILDGVFNHCGSFNKWLDRERIYEDQEGYEKGAFIDKESPYKDYFKFNKEDSWPYNPTYDGWWGHDTLPKLNYEGSRDLTDYIMKIGRKWVSAPYNADGWRLDVAADLGHSSEFNHRFWKEFRKSVKLANPNAVIIAEHYGYSRDWLMGDEWDTVMNYDAFMEPVTWFLTGMQKHSDDYREDLLGNAESFWGAMTHHGTNFTNSSLQVAMNELSNHDHSRFLTRTNRKVGRLHTLGSKAAEEGVNKAVFREAVVMQMTWPGAPTIYYGDEAGLCGFTDPDNRRTYPWGHEDKALIEFHKQMIRVHKLNTVLLTGSLMNLGEDYNYLAYGRFDKEEQIIVMVNNNGYELEKTVDAWRIGIPRNARMQRIAFTGRDGFSFDTTIINCEDGKLKVVLQPESAVVFKAIISENDRKRTLINDPAFKDRSEIVGSDDVAKAHDKTAQKKDLAQKKDPTQNSDTARTGETAQNGDPGEKAEKRSTQDEGSKNERDEIRAENVKSANAAVRPEEEDINENMAHIGEDRIKDAEGGNGKTSDKVKESEGGKKDERSKDAESGKKDDKGKGSESSKKDERSKDVEGGKKDDKGKVAESNKKGDKAKDPEDSKKDIKAKDSEDGKKDERSKDSEGGKKDDKGKGSESSENDERSKDPEGGSKDDKPKDTEDNGKDKGGDPSDKEKANSDADRLKSKTEKGLTEEKPETKKSAWEVAEEVWGKPEDNKKSWFPFFK